MLREHIKPGTSESAAKTINYTFSDVALEYPCVVPDRTTAWYLGRFPTNEEALDVMRRIDKCAEGAAMATETIVEKEIIKNLQSEVGEGYPTVEGIQPFGEEDIPVKKVLDKAAQILAASAVDFITNPSLISKAKEEFKEKMKGKEYKSLLPEGTPVPVNINHEIMKKYRGLYKINCD